MQTVNGIQYCQSIENVHCLLPCHFCSLHLGVQNHTKGLAISFFGGTFCNCSLPQCTVFNYLPVIILSLPPIKKYLISIAVELVGAFLCLRLA